MKTIGICFCFFLLLSSGPVSAQISELAQPFFSLTVKVVDEKDPQEITWNSYLLADNYLQDQQGSLRLYPNQVYHLKFRFAYRHKSGEITHSNYQARKYRVEITPSNPGRFKIKTISPLPDTEGISVHGLCLAQSDEPITFNFRLLDPQNRVLTDDALRSIILAKEMVDPSYFKEHFLDKEQMLKLQLESEKLKISKEGGIN